jgi:hypothetical protein
MRVASVSTVFNTTMLAALLIAGTATSARSEGFLKHLDTLMQNYAGSFYKDGSPGDIAEKWFRGGPKVWFSLKEMDTTMKAYGDAQQKVGEQALADLKVLGKDLISFKTYLPGSVETFGRLKARFLARAANPWADDGAGAAAGVDMASADLSGASDDSIPDSGPTAASRIRASGTRVPAGKKTESKRGMTDSFATYVGFRKTAQVAVKSAQKLEAGKRKQIVERVIAHANRMEDVLVARLSTNDTALLALDEYIKTLDAATAKGCFGPALTKLVRQANAAALAESADAKTKQLAKHASALKRSVMGS